MAAGAALGNTLDHGSNQGWIGEKVADQNGLGTPRQAYSRW
jgi:hypothetical protein